MPQLLIPLLTFVAVISLGGALLAARSARREKVQARLLAEQKLGASPGRPASPVVGALAQIGEAAGSQKASRSLRAKLAQGGYHATSAVAVYLGAKLTLLAVATLGATLLILPMERFQPHLKLLMIAWCAGVAFMIPNLVLERQRRRRCEDISRHLPDMLDLLEICVSAGMGLDLAWNAVADEIRDVCTTLADEMALTDFEIHLNAPRSVAMKHMAERTGAEEICSLAAVLVQSDRFGTSIADALRTYATSMREARSRRAEEYAEKMVVKLLFPMVLLIFPAIGIVMCGPAGLRWLEMMSGH